MDWLSIDRELHSIWKASTTEQQFLETAAKKFKWTAKATVQNTNNLIDRFKKGDK